MQLSLNDFIDELIEAGWRPTNDPGNAKISALWKSWQDDGYNASSIKILTADVLEKFDWAKVGELAHKYKRDPKWIDLGLEACRAAGESPDYFIGRYLEKDGRPKNSLVEQSYRDLRDGLI